MTATDHTAHPPDLPRDRELHVRRRLLWLGAGLVAYVSALVLSHVPDVAEAIYGSWTGPVLARGLSLVTGVIPVAIGEWIVVAFVLRQVLGAAIGTLHVTRRQRTAGNALSAAGLRLARDLGVVVTLFYVLWGFHYSRSPLEQRMDWHLPREVAINELVELTAQMVNAANDEYLRIHETDDAGHATALPADRRPTEAAVAAGWVRARRALDLPTLRGAYGRVKTPVLTPIYETFGVAGYYFPFTAEANLRAGIPAVDQVKMLAHEMAHQRGVAREAEANFWGFLSCVYAADPYARYSAYVFAQRQLMAALMWNDRDELSALLARRLPGVQRDIDDARSYWERFRGTGTAIGTRVNDAFLRSNRVAGGVENYSRSALLFLAYARKHGGNLKPET